MDTRTDMELWRNLSIFAIDDPEAEQPFSNRLASEQRWSREYTERAIYEYRRFLYLSQISPHEVSPSKPIDAVWHLHLTYTESYWEHLCMLFERPLHHRPTTGGPAEHRRHDWQYGQTLSTYEQEFGEPAPADIWPRSAKRPDLLERFLRRARMSPPSKRFEAFYDRTWGRVGGGCGGS